MNNFIPDEQDREGLTVPFFEDASNAMGVIGYTTEKSIKRLEGEIRKAMGFLGGTVSGIQTGRAPWPEADGGHRYGFRIHFTYKGVQGRMDVAALPIRKETEARKRQARRQCLLSVVYRLEALFNSQLAMPGDIPLMPYLLNEKGQTFLEYVQSEGNLPQLASPNEPDETVDGEFQEIDE